MRFEILVLAVLTVGHVALAVAADPPPATQPERAATPAAAVTDSAAAATSATKTAPVVPAASSTPTAAPKAPAPALSADEQRLLNQGYKPQMRNGEKIYCRREAELGSRIASVQHCGTVAQLTTTTQNGKDYLEKAQRTQINPIGN